jgi:hypothetical protein
MTDLTRRQMRAVGIHQALSPVLDVARDPRWGRVHETYGENPILCAAFGVAFVEGIQGDDLSEGVIATGTHFLGYGLSEGAINQAAVHLGPRELYEVFALPFEAAIRDAELVSIMSSYSEIDGVPASASPEVLTGLLRREIGFGGFVVADYYAVTHNLTKHRVAVDQRDAAIQAIAAARSRAPSKTKASMRRPSTSRSLAFSTRSSASACSTSRFAMPPARPAFSSRTPDGHLRAQSPNAPSYCSRTMESCLCRQTRRPRSRSSARSPIRCG